MAIVDQKWTPLPVPHAIEVPDRVAEGALLRPRVLRARGRAAVAPRVADGVPARGDPGAGRLRRVRDPRPVGASSCAPTTARCAPSRTPAATAACKVVEGRGTCESGFTCPFHGWCYGQDGTNTHVPQRRTLRRAQPPARRHRPRAGAVRDVGRLRLDQPRRRRPAAARVHRAGRHASSTRGRSSRCAPSGGTPCRLPVNWKLAQQAFLEQYHVVEAHPQLVHPRHALLREATGAPFDPRAFVDAELQYLRTMSEGMAGMVHANDVRIAEGLRDIELPADPTRGAWRPGTARSTTRSSSGTATAGHDVPDLNDLEARGRQRADGLLLPPLLRAADVQQRVVVPLPPARAGGDADGDLVAHPVPGGRGAAAGRRRPRCGSTTTPAGRRSPRRTSPTCRGSSAACTPRASSTCASPSRPRATSRQLRAHDRRLPRRPALRAAAARRCARST